MRDTLNDQIDVDNSSVVKVDYRRLAHALLVCWKRNGSTDKDCASMLMWDWCFTAEELKASGIFDSDAVDHAVEEINSEYEQYITEGEEDDDESI